MDANEKVKAVEKTTNSTSIPVSQETRRLIMQDVERINKKDFGRKVRVDEYVAVAIQHVTDADRKILQEGTLSPMDRLERDHRKYVAEYGQISLNDYHDKRLSGEIPPPKKESSSLTNQD